MATYDMEEGVHYACQRCGNCCRWHGEVPVTDSEIARIADFLGMELYDFIAKYTDLRANRAGLTLIDKPEGPANECVFLDGIDCTIQEVKPSQCAGFPNEWNFPGWKEKCEAKPLRIGK
ncbi:MAG: YkgJ family cysteine cluster protein [Verrucomicrobiales bacterium]|nr:YkgJ family cysteine cluster protein [Verrucomicrobiales bacterium]